MFKTTKSEYRNIGIINLILCLILLIISFLPLYAYERGYDNAIITVPSIVISLIPLIFYFVAAFLLLSKDELKIPYLLFVVANGILGVLLGALSIYVLGALTGAFSNLEYLADPFAFPRFEIGFYLILIFWIIFLCINIYLRKLKKE